MIPFLRPAPDASKKVPAEKVVSSYRWHQTGVLLSLCIGYIGYYIIRLIFTTEQNDIMKAYGFTTRPSGTYFILFWDWLRDLQIIHGSLK